MNLDNLTKIVQHEINDIAQVNKLKSLCCQLSITAKDYSTIINISPNFIAQKNLGGSYDTIIHEVSEDNSVYHSPIEIFNLIMESKKISPNTKLNYKRTKELLIEFAPLASYQDIDKRFIRALKIMRLFHRTRGKLFYLPSNAKCNRVIKRVYKNQQIGKKNISFHTGRHTAATLLLFYKIPLTTIQSILGHTHITTTEIYAEQNEATIYNSIKGVKFKEFT